jgi:hypothetical protein
MALRCVAALDHCFIRLKLGKQSSPPCPDERVVPRREPPRHEAHRSVRVDGDPRRGKAGAQEPSLVGTLLRRPWGESRNRSDERQIIARLKLPHNQRNLRRRHRKRRAHVPANPNCYATRVEPLARGPPQPTASVGGADELKAFPNPHHAHSGGRDPRWPTPPRFAAVVREFRGSTWAPPPWCESLSEGLGF